MNPYADRAPCVLHRFGYTPPKEANEVCQIDLATLHDLFEIAGFEFFTAKEAVTVRPGMISVAESLGYHKGRIFPPVDWIYRYLAGFALADEARRASRAAARVRYAYRPPDLQMIANPQSPRSDHVYALGIDLEWRTNAARNRALAHIQKLQKSDPWLRISYGYKTGSGILHIGLLTKKGARDWKY